MGTTALTESPYFSLHFSRPARPTGRPLSTNTFGNIWQREVRGAEDIIKSMKTLRQVDPWTTYSHMIITEYLNDEDCEWNLRECST